MKLKVATAVEFSQTQSKLPRDSSAQDRNFETGNKVYVKNFGQGQRWLSGTVLNTEGAVVLEIQWNSIMVV